MFYVRNQKNHVMFSEEDFVKAQRFALRQKELLPKQNFIIEEVKTVWTTQTLDEALKEG